MLFEQLEFSLEYFGHKFTKALNHVTTTLKLRAETISSCNTSTSVNIYNKYLFSEQIVQRHQDKTE